MGIGYEALIARASAASSGSAAAEAAEAAVSVQVLASISRLTAPVFEPTSIACLTASCTVIIMHCVGVRLYQKQY